MKLIESLQVCLTHGHVRSTKITLVKPIKSVIDHALSQGDVFAFALAVHLDWFSFSLDAVSVSAPNILSNETGIIWKGND